MADWDGRFLGLAAHIAGWSKDPSTQVGCVIVGPDREDRELKYPLICHAEENAIMHAARIGISLKGCTVYVTWPPCTRCARSLIQAGVSEAVYPASADVPKRWTDDFVLASEMLSEAGVALRSA